MALGSSSTQGVGASSAAASYPAELGRLFQQAFHDHPAVTVINRGIGGEDIDDMVKRIGRDILARKPDLVIWQVGSNDPLRGVPMERFKSELREGISAIRGAGVEILLMEPQWSPVIEKADTASRFVEAVRDVGNSEHVDVLRRFELMQRWMADGTVAREGLIGPDGLHMTDRGYALLAHAVYDAIVARSGAFRGRVILAGTKQP